MNFGLVVHELRLSEHGIKPFDEKEVPSPLAIPMKQYFAYVARQVLRRWRVHATGPGAGPASVVVSVISQ